MSDKGKLTSKHIILAHILTTSPLAISKGKSLSEEADSEIMKDKNGRPFIPGSSIAGAIKHWLIKTDQEIKKQYWGNSDDNNLYQSHINFENIISEGASYLKVRDGVKIARINGNAEPKKLYNYEVAEPGINFYCYIELTRRTDMDVSILTIDQIFAVLSHSEFAIGSMTNHGFGKFDLKGFKVIDFEFKIDGQNWLDFLRKLKSKSIMQIYQESNVASYDKKNSSDNDQIFKVRLTGSLKSTLIIGESGIGATQSDKVSLTSVGKPIISAKSIRGAMRSRAERICNTLKIDLAIVYNLFGNTDENDKSKLKGKLKINEVILFGSQKFVQDRIKIDRFTGGTISGALFNSEPISKADIQIDFSIYSRRNEKATDAEKGLLFLLLRDIYEEDLAIGGEKNIGRGIIKGTMIIINRI
ncbi:MAG: hypothetical protein IPG55_06810 [Saprospiraceae bacterium]|nr:hypothetical protein [Candidatus Defluviibacterium haderslevense]